MPENVDVYHEDPITGEIKLVYKIRNGKIHYNK